ncbi:hypothetical protein BGZ60DRAFT_2209 [Tricladium varicosporioides]|nr:hypothetical protein BGZ60DRAFT_2209 [Hymenoscyphus varicosporioides]
MSFYCTVFSLFYKDDGEDLYISRDSRRLLPVAQPLDLQLNLNFCRLCCNVLSSYLFPCLSHMRRLSPMKPNHYCATILEEIRLSATIRWVLIPVPLSDSGLEH